MSTSTVGEKPFVAILEQVDSRTLGAIQERGDCLVTGRGSAAAGLYRHFVPSDTSGLSRIAFFKDDFIWAEPPVAGSSVAGFTLDTEWGAILSLSDLGMARPLTSSSLQMIPAATSLKYNPAAAGERVVWVDETAGTVGVRGWSQSSGEFELERTSSYVIVALAAGRDLIAWLGGTGPGATEGNLESSALYWEEPAHTGAAESLSTPLTSVGQGIGVESPWIALRGCVADSCAVYIAHTIQRAIWRLAARDGKATRVLGIGGGDLLLLERKSGTSLAYYDRILRYDLSQVDSFAERL